MQTGPERSTTQSSDEVFSGVPLTQLVSVAAARAEGFPLEEVLEAEGLEAGSYRAADVAYKRSLVDPAQRDHLCADYQKELIRAEDRLARKISPIDEDVDAWVRFLGTYGGQSAPADWLVTIGLTLPDLSRLSRAWKTRFDADDALCKRAETSARDKKPYEVSTLRVSPAKLVPSHLAKSIQKQASGNAASLPNPSASASNHWIPRADPMTDFVAPPAFSQNLGIAFDFPINSAVGNPLAMTTPVFSLPIQEATPFVPGPEVPDDPPTLEELAAALAPPREALSGTSLAVDIPRGLVTPFAASISSKVAPDKPSSIELPKVQPLSALAGTSLAVDIPRGPVTPFVQVLESSVVEVKPTDTRLPAVKLAPQELAGTSLAVDIPRGPVTPFVAAKEASSIAEKPSFQDKLTVKQAPQELAGTSLAVDIPRGPVTPFVAAHEASSIAENPSFKDKPTVKQAPAELSGTSFSLDIPRGPVTPFVEAKEVPSPERPAKPVVAQPSAMPLIQEDKPQPKLVLSLEQHAALTVEIATYPAHALAILKRYGITPPQKVDLDHHYKRLVAVNSAAQAAWHAAYGAHYASLMQRR